MDAPIYGLRRHGLGLGPVRIRDADQPVARMACDPAHRVNAGSGFASGLQLVFVSTSWIELARGIADEGSRGDHIVVQSAHTRRVWLR
jgi:hypothetical protein